ncbi:glycosyltransferase family 39 protein [Pedobacter sp. MC2016-14]|uniref:ArnT family glycosyltransferase n=1 Tax=Pedobacter sp. MC2016-14 TaxID=2897327 RepID=UPI001E416D85|nr:glycosyltransferase family 39 protein [Pedobacter sp. MC2016-14]MCD0487894.1 glycosyltransferase family 39 protein [Pedobacter sp. MC2016-14]
MKIKEEKLYVILICLLAAFGFLGVFGGIMEPDSALYASIAKNNILYNDWLNLYVRGADWLDKPHLPFWIAALFFKVFGISAFAYKLPSFLVGLLGAWYVYQLAKSIYTDRIGLRSVVIFLSALHVLISTFDVRAEIYITTFTLASIYHYYRAHQSSVVHLVAGSFFTACAIMVKGIFVLIPVFAGFIIYWLFTKQYKQLIKIKWWLAIVLIFVFISPELYSLYHQFDLHPEKVVFGSRGVSGLKFFFWDSQFGRFFNSGPIKGSGDKSFFLHTTLWAFLPWSVLLYTAVVNLFKKKNRAELADESIILWASAAVTFLLFSFSKFQLPHYILIVFPQFAIITALYMEKLEGKPLKVFYTVHTVIYVLVFILLGVIAVFSGFEHAYWMISALLLIAISAFVFFKEKSVSAIVGRNAAISIGLMSFLYLFFYPALLKYEGGMQAGQWLRANYPEAKPAVLLNVDAYSFDFYANAEVKYLMSYEDLDKAVATRDLVIYVQDTELQNIKSKYKTEVLKSFENYHITKLSGKFLNANTRAAVLEHFYLVKLH